MADFFSTYGQRKIYYLIHICKYIYIYIVCKHNFKAQEHSTDGQIFTLMSHRVLPKVRGEDNEGKKGE